MIVLVALLLAHASSYLPFLIDDALISLRYAERLLAGKGLTWTDGPPVEGYSNFLWVLADAFLGFLGVDLITAVQILGYTCMAAVVVAAVMFYARRPHVDRFDVVAGLLFFACSGPIAVWTIGGLEQPLIAAALAGAVLAYWSALESNFENRTAAVLAGTFLGVLCLTRPDGPLFTAALAAAFVAGVVLKCHRWSWPFLLTFALIPIACFLGQLAFRLAYYHDWVPNTAYAKVAFSWRHLRDGWEYVRKAHRCLLPLSLIAVVCLLLGLADRRRRGRFIPLAAMLAAWIGYLAFIGGDIFPAYRHYVAVIVLLAFALIEGGPVLWNAIRAELAVPRWVLWLGLVVLCGFFLEFQYEDGDNHMAMINRAEWDGRLFALDLKQVFSEKQPLTAVTAAGCIPYWSQLPCLDMLGLNDYYLARHPPADLGKGLIGHELGNGAYVLRMKPDIMLFDLGETETPTFVTGRELSDNPEFARDYSQIVMTARRIQGSREPPTAYLWLRRDSEKIGIRRTRESITIPAYFFNANKATRAFPRGDHLVIAVDSERPAGICLDRLRAADWTPEVHGQGPGAVQCRVEPCNDGLQIRLTTPATGPTIVDEVVLRCAHRGKAA